MVPTRVVFSVAQNCAVCTLHGCLFPWSMEVCACVEAYLLRSLPPLGVQPVLEYLPPSVFARLQRLPCNLATLLLSSLQLLKL